MGHALLADGGDAPKIRVHRIDILACKLGVMRIRKRWVQKRAVWPLALMECAPEILFTPPADARFGVRRYVGGAKFAERRQDRAAPGIRYAAAFGVAAAAVSGGNEICAAGDSISKIAANEWHRDRWSGIFTQTEPGPDKRQKNRQQQ